MDSRASALVPRNGNPKRKQWTVSQVPHLRIGLSLVVCQLFQRISVGCARLRLG